MFVCKSALCSGCHIVGTYRKWACTCSINPRQTKTRYTNITLKHSTHARSTSTTSSAARCGPAFESACTRGCVQMVHVNMSVHVAVPKYRRRCRRRRRHQPTSGSKMAFTRDDELRWVHTTPTAMRTCSIHVFPSHVFTHSHTRMCARTLGKPYRRKMFILNL